MDKGRDKGTSPTVSNAPFLNLLVYSLMMIVLPIGGFFSSKYFIFEGNHYSSNY